MIGKIESAAPIDEHTTIRLNSLHCAIPYRGAAQPLPIPAETNIINLRHPQAFDLAPEAKTVRQ